jgi:hypothetical protein
MAITKKRSHRSNGNGNGNERYQEAFFAQFIYFTLSAFGTLVVTHRHRKWMLHLMCIVPGAVTLGTALRFEAC